MKSNKMKNMKKRLLALVLCMAMVMNGGISAVASDVAAFGGTTEPQTASLDNAHAHTEECYVRTKVSEEPICGKEVIEGHVHGDACYEVTSIQELTCTLKETEGHSHGDGCTETVEVLTCTTTEHAHGDGCYTTEKELNCGQEESEEHTHDDGCYVESTECTCGTEEHSHGGDCYQAETNTICGLEEVAAHAHGEGCYTTTETETLICDLEAVEAHTHSDDCYEWTEELVCTIEVAKPAEILVCETCGKETCECTPVVCEVCEKEPCESTSDELVAEAGETTITLLGSEEAFDAEKTYALQVNELEEETAAMVATAIKDAARTANLEVLDYQAFDITLTADEEASQPKAEVEVKFTGAKIEEYIVAEDAEVKAFYVDAEGNVEDIALTEGENEVVITTDHFSTYVVASVKTAEPVVLTTEVDGTTITLSGPVSAFAEGKTYEITAAKVEEEEELEVIEEALEEVAEEQEKVVESYQAFDIKIIEKDETGAVTNENFQPLNETPVQVMFSGDEVAESVENEETEVSVYWIDEENGATNTDAFSDGTNVAMETEHFSVYVVAEMSEYKATDEELDGEAAEEIGETADMNGLCRLVESGWFEEYSEEAERILAEEEEKTQPMQKNAARRMFAMKSRTTPPPSDEQVVKRGGENTSADGVVKVSKTIAGTELENVFDITLEVQTQTKIEDLYKDPDMAVVVVMDISESMMETIPESSEASGTKMKYTAAMQAAEDFVNMFRENNTTGVSRIGYVAFNTDSHEICDLQECYTEEQATVFKNNMRVETGKIIASYKDETTGDSKGLPTRFTNIEAGLQLARDMLGKSTNQYKYIVFLSDGLPTTYIEKKESGEYKGYTPGKNSGTVGTDGRFYDTISGKDMPQWAGCNYSDKAAIKAEAVAKALREEDGVKIFAVGAGLNSFKGSDNDGTGRPQNLSGTEFILNQLERAKKNNFSTIDNNISSATFAENKSMRIGSLDDEKAFEKWLGGKIGSGYNTDQSKNYYYDTVNEKGLRDAYKRIFEKIKTEIAQSSQLDWVSRDPIPTASGSAEKVEFIGFYDKKNENLVSSLQGVSGVGGENTALFNQTSSYAIDWDLKKSGYLMDDSGTSYIYKLKYRVRLRNEDSSFDENETENGYPTNDTTSLTYRFVERVNAEKPVISEQKTVNFPIPAVKGYLGELQFQKVDAEGNPVAGAEFTLAHDTTNCSICRGDGTAVSTVENYVKVSATDGTVTFDKIPSGHVYTLRETLVPDGYISLGEEYRVTVAYDEILVELLNAPEGWEWNKQVVNPHAYELPSTGGIGTEMHKISGLALMSVATLFLHKRKKDEEV